MFEFGHQLARTLALGQRQRHVADPFAALGALDAQAFQAAHAAFIAGAAGFHALADPDFLLGQQLVEAGLFEALGFQPLGLALLPLREVAGEAEQPAAVQLDDAGGHRIQEAAVVGDDDGGAFPGAQHFFEPGDAVEVEVVGGLVQQQQIGFLDQRAGQRDALAGAARQAGDLGVRRQAELFEHGAHARRALPVLMVAVDVADHVEHGGVFVQLRFLFDRGHAQARAAGDVAIVGHGAAVEQPQQRGLAGAVAADEADALAGLDGEVGVVQQRMVAIGQLDVGQGDERCESHVVSRSCGGVSGSSRIVAGTRAGVRGRSRDLY